jgi:hypothetical protein
MEKIGQEPKATCLPFFEHGRACLYSVLAISIAVAVFLPDGARAQIPAEAKKFMVSPENRADIFDAELPEH